MYNETGRVSDCDYYGEKTAEHLHLLSLYSSPSYHVETPISSLSLTVPSAPIVSVVTKLRGVG